MKKKNNNKPAVHSYTMLKQICNIIPAEIVNRAAKVHGVDVQARTFSPWSHVVSMMYGQLTHAIGLNDVCDSLRMHGEALSTIRGASAPSRNNLSYANRERSADMAETLYWDVFEHLQEISPDFCKGNCRGYLKRFKKAIHAVDSTTIQLVANCISWAKHRRRKAAAKCHMRLNLQSFLPGYVIIDTAKDHDSKKTFELCAGLQDGEIVIFDKAYIDFEYLWSLTSRGVFWVTRAKDNMQYTVVKKLKTTDNKRIISDEVIRLNGVLTSKDYPGEFRLVTAMVEVDGREQEMTFISNNIEWSAASIMELYRSRWDIEVFFKEIKQTLQLADFFGQNANAVRWQVWTGLLVHLLLRYLSFLYSWSHSFTRIFTVVRSGLWNRWCLTSLLQSYGTAKRRCRLIVEAYQAYFEGFPLPYGTAERRFTKTKCA